VKSGKKTETPSSLIITLIFNLLGGRLHRLSPINKTSNQDQKMAISTPRLIIGFRIENGIEKEKMYINTLQLSFISPLKEEGFYKIVVVGYPTSLVIKDWGESIKDYLEIFGRTDFDY